MAVAYTQTLSVDMVLSEIEALEDWRNQIVRNKFYPESQTRETVVQAPSALLMWCRREMERNAIDRKIIDRMSLVYDELCKVAQQVVDAPAPLPVDIYDSFERQVESYVTQIRRLQQDLADSAGAVDMLTGLRTVAGMRAELKREQDRFDRKGTPFSIAHVEIDKVEELKGSLDRRSLDAVYASVAQMIARTLRSFDDAYYMGSGEYLVVLKHVEFMDACSVMDRLRGEIESTPVMLPNGEQLRVTASFGISEALQREPADVAMDHAKAALLEAKGTGGNRVSEYRETSALEQYAKDIGGKIGS